MTALVALLLATVALMVIFKVRSDASASRKEVLARLRAESEASGVVSPTAELFREVGVPISDELAANLVDAPVTAPAQGGTRIQTVIETLQPNRSDLSTAAVPAAPSAFATFLAGIVLPSGLVPLASAANDTSIAFVTTQAERPTLAQALTDELGKIQLTTRWIDGSTAQIQGPEGLALVSIYDRPEHVREPDGSATFPTVSAGQVVVRFTTLA